MRLESMHRAGWCLNLAFDRPHIVAGVLLAALLWLPAVSSAVTCNSTVTGNFDGVCKSDLLWRSTNGQLAMWFMNGTAIGSSGLPASPGAEWTVQGVGDFDASGKADILWRRADGTVAIWLMNGSAVTGSGSPGTPGLNWTIQGVGHFDTSGRAGIVWQDSASGAIAIWLMDPTGLAVASGVVVATPGPNWSVQGIGDFDGSGTSDILLRDMNTGNVVIWLMSGATIMPGSGLVAANPGYNWSIQGVGDFDGDGKSDILLRDSTTGSAAIWLMNGISIAGSGFAGTPAQDWSVTFGSWYGDCCIGNGNGWSIQGVGDFDGNGKSDIVWRNADGTIAIWLMNGISIAGSGSPGVPGSAWQLATLAPYGCSNQVLCNLLNGMNNVRANGSFGPAPNPAPSATALGALFPFRWDVSAAWLAQGWTNQCNFQHPPNGPVFGVYGQNIFGTGGTVTGSDAVGAWAGEASGYHYSTPTGTCSGTTCGHYTQIVWRNTNAVGCAVQPACPINGGSFAGGFVACDFSPGGNFSSNTNGETLAPY